MPSTSVKCHKGVRNRRRHPKITHTFWILCLFVLAVIFVLYLTQQSAAENLDNIHYNQQLRWLNSSNCNCPGSSHIFCYSPPNTPYLTGIQFDCSHADEINRLTNYHYPINESSRANANDAVFVTAFNEDFLENGKRLIATIRQLGLRNKIIVYNLGSKSLEFLAESTCNIEIRQFNFSRFSANIRQLRNYRWKPIVIAEVATKHKLFWYMDTSVVLKTKNLNLLYELISCNNSTSCVKSPYLLHGSSGHGIYPVTHPETYEYFPTNFTIMRVQGVGMFDAGFALIAADRYATRHLIHWYAMCALQDYCMDPKYSQLYCKFNGNRMTDYANCHRYDQSIINLLLANYFNYNSTIYSSGQSFFDITRQTTQTTSLEEMKCKN